MDELRFDGRVAVVTGAGRGIGRAHAMLFAARGASVVVNDLPPSIDPDAPARAVAEEISSGGGRAVVSEATVSTQEGAEAIVSTALEQFGRVDIVVNNAGVSSRADVLGRPAPETFVETDLDHFMAHLVVHLAGAFNVTRAAWPSMATQRYGRVVMTTSAAGLYGQTVSYASAKTGLVGLARSLATIGAEVGITVNLLSPRAATRMTEAVARERALTYPSAESVAAVAAVLAHEFCPANGEILFASGRRVARDFLAETAGYVGDGEPLTPEDVLEHWDDVQDEAGYYVPRDLADFSAFAMRVELGG